MTGAGLGYPSASVIVDRFGVSAAFATGSAVALVVLQHFAGADGVLTGQGFTAAALTSSAVSGVAAVMALVLARSVREPIPEMVAGPSHRP